jgi:hypothetical protein
LSLFIRHLLSRILLLSCLVLALMLKMGLLALSTIIFLKTAYAHMLGSSVPPHFWVETISTATYLSNIQPFTVLQGVIPFERLCVKIPEYSSLRLFYYVLYASCTS